MSDIFAALEKRRANPHFPVGGVGEGWADILTALHRELVEIDPNYSIHQIKEKFGLLRFYSTLDAQPEGEEAIRQAEIASSKTCEFCGGLGYTKPNANGWLKTLCDTHHAQRDRALVA